MTVDEITREALALPIDVRSGLADQLLNSLDDIIEEDLATTLERRIHEIDEGTVAPLI